MGGSRARLTAFLALLPLQAVELVTPRGADVTLPAGAVADVLEAVDLGGPRRALELTWPEWSDRGASGWGGERPWRRWVELVRAEAAAATPSASRRAELAALARLQGREGAAWAHFVACAGDPATVAALFPLFAPGVSAAATSPSAPLPDGVLLRPALPPADDPRATLRDLAGRSLEQRAVAVGDGVLSLRVEVDRDGVALHVDHVSGGALRVRALVPVPQGIEPGTLFADWEKLARNDEPVEFLLSSEEPEHSLWLTFRPLRAGWPAPLPAELVPLRPERAAWILSPGGNEPHLARFCEALSELLGAPVRLGAAEPRPAGLEPLLLRLDAPETAEQKLVSLIDLAEGFALARR